LKGYHLYHNQLCVSYGAIGSYIDNSPVREMYIDSTRSDPYLLDRSGNFNLEDPRYPLSAFTTFSPAFNAEGTANTFNDCTGGGQGHNCAMPRAVYKVYAAGTWLTVESGWPDYFHTTEQDPFRRCDIGLTYPDFLPACGDGRDHTSSTIGDPDFVPAPSKVTAAGAGPGSVQISWVRPTIPAGKAQVAGYY